MLKTHHKMKGWHREFHYLSAKITGKIIKYQYLHAKSIHFSLSHLTLSSLSHIPLSPVFSRLRLHSQLRPSVRPSPSSGKLKTYAFARYYLKFQKITYVFYCT